MLALGGQAQHDGAQQMQVQGNGCMCVVGGGWAVRQRDVAGGGEGGALRLHRDLLWL